MPELPPMQSSNRCAGCLNRKIYDTILCPDCIEKSARTSHRLDGHTTNPIEGCPACRSASNPEFREKLGLPS